MTNDGSDFNQYDQKEILDCGPYYRYKSVAENKSWMRKLVCAVIGFYYWLEDDFFVSLFEKCFFTYIEQVYDADILNCVITKNPDFIKEHNNANFYLFYKARSLSLKGSNEEAFELYKQLEKDRTYYDESVYFQAKTLLKMKRFADFYRFYSATMKKYSWPMELYLREHHKFLNEGKSIRYLYILKEYVAKLKSLDDKTIERLFQLTGDEMLSLKLTLNKINF